MEAMQGAVVEVDGDFGEAYEVATPKAKCIAAEPGPPVRSLRYGSSQICRLGCSCLAFQQIVVKGKRRKG